ncbi:MAG: endonuclease/exonuclease/phosphatase family protein [Candidatus Omnitrophica bacterium]|nr:endonuclease/exonuclease/phosphatase family protein [Candidatus Omnitrophota bacterium]
MKKVFLLVFSIFLTAAFFADAATADDPAIRIMTYNIRMNTPSDGINAWPNRKDHVAEMIRDKYQVDIVGVQEALIEQVHDLEARLTDYMRIGVGRDNGWDQGEHMAIFFRKDRFELLQQNTFWLSETPEIPGVTSWESACNRIVTWGKFKDRTSGREFYHFNTHFDHRSQKARVESAKLIWRRIQAMTNGLPVVLTGDFNIQETNEAYAILTGKEPADGDDRSDLKDARYITKIPHQGPTSTFTRNQWTETGAPETKIDFIFVRNGFQVLSHQVPNDKYDGRYPSDHLPVVADLAFPE